MGDRVYPQQPMLHQVDCRQAPSGLFAFPARAAAPTYLYAFPHDRCIGPGTVGANRMLVAVPIEFDPHRYDPHPDPGMRPDDAISALCKICHGNHVNGALSAGVQGSS